MLLSPPISGPRKMSRIQPIRDVDADAHVQLIDRPHADVLDEGLVLEFHAELIHRHGRHHACRHVFPGPQTSNTGRRGPLEVVAEIAEAVDARQADWSASSVEPPSCLAVAWASRVTSGLVEEAPSPRSPILRPRNGRPNNRIVDGASSAFGQCRAHCRLSVTRWLLANLAAFPFHLKQHSTVVASPDGDRFGSGHSGTARCACAMSGALR